MRQKKNIPIKRPVGFFIFILCVAIASCYAIFWKFFLSSHPYIMSVSHHAVTPTGFLLPTARPTFIPFPNFSTNSSQLRNTFDTSTWQQYDNSEIGLRFKYPPEWGTPSITYRKGQVSGMYYRLSFSHSRFMVSGETSDFADLPRDGDPTDFKGFSDIGDTYAWLNPKTFCQQDYFAFCQIASNKADVIQEPAFIFPYYRLAYINRPGKAIGGLRFGGDFLSPEMDKLTWGFQDSRGEYRRAHIKDFDTAILQRKLDQQSMYIFDQYEKVFETIEN